MIVVGNLPLIGLSADDVKLSTRTAYSPTAMQSQLAPSSIEPPRIMTAPAPQPYPDLVTDQPVDPYVDCALPVVSPRKCKWWCWLLIAGGVATVGGLTYYVAKR